MGSSKIAIGSSLGLPLTTMGLLLIHLILGQHLEDLGLLGDHFGQVWGGGGGLLPASCWELSPVLLVFTILQYSGRTFS